MQIDADEPSHQTTSSETQQQTPLEEHALQSETTFAAVEQPANSLETIIPGLGQDMSSAGTSVPTTASQLTANQQVGLLIRVDKCRDPFDGLL